MNGSRIDNAIQRIEQALARIDTASAQLRPAESSTPPNVLSLVNKHEKLREEVAATIKDLDAVIAEIGS